MESQLFYEMVLSSYVACAVQAGWVLDKLEAGLAYVHLRPETHNPACRYLMWENTGFLLIHGAGVA